MSENQILFDQAVAAAQRKDFSSARGLLKQLLKQDPNNLNAWLLAAHVVETRADAIGSYKRVLQLDPNHAYARQRLSALESEPQKAAPVAAQNVPQTSPIVEKATPLNSTVTPSPTANLPKKQIRPEMMESPSPSKTKSNQGVNLVLLGGLLLIVCCVAIIGIALVSRGGGLFAGAAPTPTADELFNVLYRNARAANDENVAGYMATIHPDSPAYQSTESSLKELFSVYELEFLFTDLRVTNLGSSEARIHFTLSTRRLRGPAFRDNVVIGTMILRIDNGEWKIYNQEIEDVQYR